jgi:hypothetical protein
MGTDTSRGRAASGIVFIADDRLTYFMCVLGSECPARCIAF